VQHQNRSLTIDDCSHRPRPHPKAELFGHDANRGERLRLYEMLGSEGFGRWFVLPLFVDEQRDD
jgi:hypothetical protein